MRPKSEFATSPFHHQFRFYASLGAGVLVALSSAPARADEAARGDPHLVGITTPLRPEPDAANAESAPDAAATDAPPAAEPAPEADFDERKIRRLPMGPWTELGAGCRLLTTFSRSSEGCSFGVRTGDVAYFHASAGFYTTPAFERYARYANPSTSSTSSGASLPNTTVIEPSARSTVYYLELGPGAAIWATRTFRVHIEGGGYIGASSNRASQALNTKDSTNFAAGVFAGTGVSYRLPSMPWAFGFDYRIQSITYGGVGEGEEVSLRGLQVGHSLIGVAHSFGLSAIVRFERDRTN